MQAEVPELAESALVRAESWVPVLMGITPPGFLSLEAPLCISSSLSSRDDPRRFIVGKMCENVAALGSKTV